MFPRRDQNYDQNPLLPGRMLRAGWRRLSAAHQRFQAASGSLHERFGHTLAWRVGRPALRVARVGSAAVSQLVSSKKMAEILSCWCPSHLLQAAAATAVAALGLLCQTLRLGCAERHIYWHTCQALLLQPPEALPFALQAGVYLMGYSTGVRSCLEVPLHLSRLRCLAMCCSLQQAARWLSHTATS